MEDCVLASVAVPVLENSFTEIHKRRINTWFFSAFRVYRKRPVVYNGPVLLVLIVGNKAKGRISKRAFQENKSHQIFRKTNISYPVTRTRTCADQGVRNVCFSENLVCCFLETPVLRFALLPYYRRNTRDTSIIF